ncbi:hypothetical protein [Bartonella apihabitans]|uniref:hypothetical protein n=1 Tax=Bartonella apihabitans TaxID=2750929 RepID=UPI003BB73B6F
MSLIENNDDTLAALVKTNWDEKKNITGQIIERGQFIYRAYLLLPRNKRELAERAMINLLRR